ncbi:MAG: hypothetical protein JWR54_2887 [Mucilaginibacter sp.]|nr:hypothetical protein [Mucilaginibacter sp.]
MIKQISIFNRGHKAMIILFGFGFTFILAYFYAEFILTLINFLAIKISTHGLLHQ